MPNKAPFFVEGKREYLFYTDQKGISLLQPIIGEIFKKNTPFKVVMKEDDIDFDLTKWLKDQKMGSYLYAALPWEELFVFKNVVEEIGFTEEESQFIGYGQQTIKVFCCRCHGMTEGKNLEMDQEIHCSYCQLLLVVSDHYSRVKNAYLGYVAKL
ncbi:hypothetical protein [Neobacillus sp. D3-1R]|uniref:hypothetical protein n=1 Tax=Neobacillus sp. D3-1R TaxID=3445778 RepID=UPI003FA0D929